MIAPGKSNTVIDINEMVVKLGLNERGVKVCVIIQFIARSVVKKNYCRMHTTNAVFAMFA